MAEVTLQRSLRGRHITMISIGGVIGAGLFVGSSTVIATVGPPVVISYLIAGIIVFLVMQMLGELAANRRGVPTFTEYTRAPLGDCVAFVTGWLYAYFWLIVVAVETIAGSFIIQAWLHVPNWSIAMGLLCLLTLTNLFSVRVYGEFEFWFASIKVVAILAFIAIGLAYICAHLLMIGGSTSAVPRSTGNAVFEPRGAISVLAGVPAVIFSICGAEIAAIAAAESVEPEQNIARLSRSVILRVLFFYVGSVLIIISVVPWTKVVPGYSPFVTALKQEQVPFGAIAMNVVILTAVLSCLNSGLYVASRVIHGLATRGDAPKLLLRLDRRQTPVIAVLVSATIAFACTLVSILSWEKLFSFLLNASGALMLIVYMSIAIAQIRSRLVHERQSRDALRVPMWLFPWASYGAVAAMMAILCTMPFIRGMASQFVASITATAFAIAVFWLRRRLRGSAVSVQV